MSLNEVDAAIAMSEKALATHPQEDVLWSFYANALKQKGDVDRAIAALDKVKEINPSDLSAATRQGNWLLQAGRVQEAIGPYSEVAQADPSQADAVASQLFADAHAKGINVANWDYALRSVVAIKQIPNITPAMQNQLNFWHGWSLYNQADKEAQPRTFATATATLPKFQQALELFGRVGNYPASVGVNLAAMIENTGTFIEIQEQLIRRGR
jgi:tetratricopeptide (TPR) repeat protein